MKFAEMTWPEIARVAPSSAAVLPLGATEQHGPHLAVSTDSLIVGRIAERLEAEMPHEVVLCPPLPFGSSHHHLAFGGTISLPADLYTNVIVSVVNSLVAGGFRRIVLLNGHGGNITPVRQALAMLGNQLTESAQVVLATYWELAGRPFAGQAPMESPSLSHACEYETSLMMHLEPGRVWMDRVERASRPPANGYVPWEDEHAYRGVSIAVPTQRISSNGSSGEPQLATAEKGAFLFDAAVDAVRRFILSFLEWPAMGDLRHA